MASNSRKFVGAGQPQKDCIWLVLPTKIRRANWPAHWSMSSDVPVLTEIHYYELHQAVKQTPIYLHLIFEILKFEISSLTNWISFLVWTGYLLPV